MPHDYSSRPLTEVRRRDRAVDDDGWIIAMLERAALGTLATVADGQPFINSNLFVFAPVEQAIYMHTARHGRTRTNIEAEAATPVCFSISEMGRLLPAEAALEFSVEYASVILFGTAQMLEDADAAAHGLQLLLDKYFPHLRPARDYRPIAPEELARTAVYRIAISQWSGKRKQVAEDFPGAFRYPYQARSEA